MPHDVATIDYTWARISVVRFCSPEKIELAASQITQWWGLERPEPARLILSAE
jgi:hypothetical protein